MATAALARNDHFTKASADTQKAYEILYLDTNDFGSDVSSFFHFHVRGCHLPNFLLPLPLCLLEHFEISTCGKQEEELVENS